MIWQWLGFVLPLFLVLFFTIIYATISGRNFSVRLLVAIPFWCARWFGSLKSAAQAAATYVVRRRAWPLLQALALGLESYRYPLPQVERNPTHFAAGEVTYEDLPADVEERALSAREDWIARHLGNVSETFSKMLVTSADINALLRLISVDQSLVHGTYYTDEACIERIRGLDRRRPIIRSRDPSIGTLVSRGGWGLLLTLAAA